jgi:tetratricopeptide (TPR) repeat protein
MGVGACGQETEREAVPEPAAPAVLSLLGERLLPLADTTGSLQRALDALSAAPDDVELLLAAGHAHASLRDYVEAIRLYGGAIDVAPGDWRGPRYRGHRYVSIRRLPQALRDLERARELEPRSFDVAYHLGLAYYLAEAYGPAADEYGRCMALAEDPEALTLEASGALGEGFRSCMSIATDDNARVAMTDWRFRALRRAGRLEEADALLPGITASMDVASNTAYHHVLLFYKGQMSEDELLHAEDPAEYRFETVGYPVATWYLTEGDTARALELLESVASDPHWPGFGRIAAEMDLTSLR